MSKKKVTTVHVQSLHAPFLELTDDAGDYDDDGDDLMRTIQGE